MLNAIFPSRFLSEKQKSSLDFFLLMKPGTNVGLFVKAKWRNMNFWKAGEAVLESNNSSQGFVVWMNFHKKYTHTVCSTESWRTMFKTRSSAYRKSGLECEFSIWNVEDWGVVSIVDGFYDILWTYYCFHPSCHHFGEIKNTPIQAGRRGGL